MSSLRRVFADMANLGGPTPSDSGHSGHALVLRSATPLDASPPKSIPEKTEEPLTAPEWKMEEEGAIKWFTQLRKTLKSSVYRFCAALQKALEVFEKNNASHNVHYLDIGRTLSSCWIRWRSFVTEKTITTDFIRSSIIHDDFEQVIKSMRTPRTAAQQYAIEMEELRQQVRMIVNEVVAVRGLVDEALVRLNEIEAGYLLGPFLDMPNVDDTPDPEVLNIATTFIDADESDVDSDDELDNYIGLRDENLLSENDLEPIWTSDGYPGKIPDEIAEYLCSDGTSEYHCLSLSLSFHFDLWIRSLADDWLYAEHFLGFRIR